jgi:hypothetical protein
MALLESKLLSKNEHRTPLPDIPRMVAMGGWLLERDEHRTPLPDILVALREGLWVRLHSLHVRSFDPWQHL